MQRMCVQKRCVYSYSVDDDTRLPIEGRYETIWYDVGTIRWRVWQNTLARMQWVQDNRL